MSGIGRATGCEIGLIETVGEVAAGIGDLGLVAWVLQVGSLPEPLSRSELGSPSPEPLPHR